MESVEQVAGSMGEAQTDDAEVDAPEADAPTDTMADSTEAAPSEQEQPGSRLQDTASAEPGTPIATAAEPATPGATPSEFDAPVAPQTANAADPWAAILEAGAALLQGLASSRNLSKCGRAVPPIQIERDPETGQASVRLPLPDAAVLQKLAKALEPWLR
jgi:hypothetical protein